MVTVYPAIDTESPYFPTSVCPFRTSLMTSVDVKHYKIKKKNVTLSAEFRSCVEVALPSSSSLISLIVYVDAKQH